MRPEDRAVSQRGAVPSTTGAMDGDRAAHERGGVPDGERPPLDDEPPSFGDAPSPLPPSNLSEPRAGAHVVGGRNVDGRGSAERDGLDTGEGGFDLASALRSVFTSTMAEIAIAEVRVGRIEPGSVELVGSQASVQYFRSRLDDVSRAVSGAIGRRVRASIVSDLAPADQGDPEAPGGAPTVSVDDHPLVMAAKRAFNAEVARVEPTRRMESNV
jgi:hypothetical protein